MLMEKLLKECELCCVAEEQIRILEKCLALVGLDRDNQSRSMGWLLLARVLERCDSQCLRAAQSRLGKRLVDVKNEPTVHGGIFVRQLLIRIPQIGNLHAEVVHSVITRFIDLAIGSGDHMFRRLSIELYSICYGCDAQMSEILLNTLYTAITKRLLSQEERAGVLQLKSLGVSSLQRDLCVLLFELYSSSLCFAKSGQFVLRDDIMKILEEGLNDLQLQDAALSTVRSLCTNGRTAFLPIVPQLVTILISKLNTPSESLFCTLAHICRVYGPGSTLFRHFYVIYCSLRHPLDEMEYGLSAGSLLSAIIQTSSFLVKPEVLMSVQQKISERAVLNPNSSIYRDLLTSFLVCTHELVPAPVQIARTIIRRRSDTIDVQALNNLCDLLSRPRMQNLANDEVVHRVLVKLGRDADMDDTIINDTAIKEPIATINVSTVEVAKEFGGKICKAVEETIEENCTIEKPLGDQATASIEKLSVVEKPSTSQEIASTSTAFNGFNTDDEVMVEQIPVGSKINVVNQSAFISDVLDADEPTSKKIKKSNDEFEKPSQMATVLEGELSVEEILSTFCPD